MAMKYGVTEQLHPATADLVNRFSVALAEKLLRAQQKYKYGDNWRSPDWQYHCRHELMRHALKGDPLDVAAYCAFCWHHGWSTAPIDVPNAAVQDPV